MKRIVADPRKCLACRTCELACAMAHVEVQDLAKALFEAGARPRVFIQGAGALAVPLQCRHCEDAPCVAVCPSGALGRADGESPVLVDQAKCIGCEFCVQVCPFGVIQLAAEQKAIIKCDLCVARLAEGLAPACVASCPVRALAFEEIGDDAARKRLQTALRVAEGELR
ncbi:MAG: 4Fe-4S dicluster domain-containing protein [Opitutales bacterium]